MTEWTWQPTGGAPRMVQVKPTKPAHTEQEIHAAMVETAQRMRNERVSANPHPDGS